jgi:protein-S-isoprenylcysteine O-methyltransferase Ste14
MPERDNAGVVVPPPLIFAGTLLAGLALDRFVIPSTLDLTLGLRLVVGGLLLLLGLTAIALALKLFRRAGTRPEPWQPSAAIVDTGIYRSMRNPMYLGMALGYAGAAFLLDSGVALVLLAPLVIVIRYGVIGREEAYLEGKFGEPYRQYKARVRRWL